MATIMFLPTPSALLAQFRVQRYSQAIQLSFCFLSRYIGLRGQRTYRFSSGTACFCHKPFVSRCRRETKWKIHGGNLTFVFALRRSFGEDKRFIFVKQEGLFKSSELAKPESLWIAKWRNFLKFEVLLLSIRTRKRCIFIPMSSFEKKCETVTWWKLEGTVLILRHPSSKVLFF